MRDSRAGMLGEKVALVTGGASGIGRALCEELAGLGTQVFVADRQTDLADQVAGGIRRTGGRADAVELDVRDAAAFGRAARDVRARAGRIDYLFNNAGIGVAGEMSGYAQADWDDVVDVNLRGVIHGVQAVYPAMIRQGSGHIVNTASMAGLVATPEAGSYTTTKFAVVGLSRALRMEAARYGVRVSVLCPGVIRTPILTGGRFGRVPPGLREDVMLRLWERGRPLAPSVFARKAIRAVLRNDAVIVVPRWWKAFWYLDRLSPALSERLWRRTGEQVRAELLAAGVKIEPRPAEALAGDPGEPSAAL